MFRRTSKSADHPTGSTATKGPGAKGRPTPSRKEAEAAARERARAGKDKKAAQKLLRERRTSSNAKMREGMRTGDERYLPARDQGPVRRFIRNYVDARVSVAEFVLPLLLLAVVPQYAGYTQLAAFSSAVTSTVLLLTAVDSAWLLYRLKRALREKFPDESLRGTTTYTLMRVLQVRWLRMPKPQVKIGGAPR